MAFVVEQPNKDSEGYLWQVRPGQNEQLQKTNVLKTMHTIVHPWPMPPRFALYTTYTVVSMSIGKPQRTLNLRNPNQHWHAYFLMHAHTLYTKYIHAPLTPHMHEHPYTHAWHAHIARKARAAFGTFREPAYFYWSFLERSYCQNITCRENVFERTVNLD